MTALHRCLSQLVQPANPALETISKHRCRHIEPTACWKRLSSHRPARTGRWEHGRRPVPRPAARPRSCNPGPRCPSSGTPVWKRAFDIGLILIILPVILVLALFVYCWIKAVSPGPVLFRQIRIGRGGKPFPIYKFRSMKPDAATGPHRQHVKQLIRSGQPMTKLDLLGDPRLIKGGCFLRMAGIDELPQLLNVLRSEMSLIGPRPCLPDEFSFHDAGRRGRFSVQPGLTGLWQVRRTPSTTFPAMVEMDEEYVSRMSPWLDLMILAKTPVVLFQQIKTCTRQRVGSPAMTAGRAAPPIPGHGFAQPMNAPQKPVD